MRRVHGKRRKLRPQTRYRKKKEFDPVLIMLYVLLAVLVAVVAVMMWAYFGEIIVV